MKTRHLVAAGLLTIGAGFGLAGADPCDDVDTRIDSAPDTFATAASARATSNVLTSL